jgi:transposase-like protein
LLREMIQFVAQPILETDVEGLCAAACGERGPDRANRRNGYRDRLWDTRAGAVDLKIATGDINHRQLVMALRRASGWARRTNGLHQFSISATARAANWQRCRAHVAKPLQPHWFLPSGS